MSGQALATQPTPTELLIDRAVTLKRTIESSKVELGTIEAKLLTLGKGWHTGHEIEGVPVNRILVVSEVPGGTKYELDADDYDNAKEIVGDLDIFKKLFDRKVVYSPCKGFIDVVTKLVSKGIASKLLGLCAKPTSGKKAHVRYEV